MRRMPKPENNIQMLSQLLLLTDFEIIEPSKRPAFEKSAQALVELYYLPASKDSQIIDKNKKVFEKRFFEKKSIEEISIEVKITKLRVQQILWRMKKRFIKKFSEVQFNK